MPRSPPTSQSSRGDAASLRTPLVSPASTASTTQRYALEPYEFPGWGTHQPLPTFRPPRVRTDSLPSPTPQHVLSQWPATAICGNDITSSVLYVVGLCVSQAGYLAPVCLVIVSFILYLFRFIYGRAVTSVPVNGGTYSVLSNSTTKAVAALAACLTLLSYVATCVVSATDAVVYMRTLSSDIPQDWTSIGVLLVFALLALWGITDSANVALLMFVTHLVTLATLAVTCVIHIAKHDGGNFKTNFDQPLPDIMNGDMVVAKGSVATALFFGLSSALLGVSGFETSANFVEEQDSGVFVKTLRNMWVAVSVINPVMAVLALGVLNPTELQAHASDMLAEMASVAGGSWLKTWVALDAGIVLCGSVLTSYVGVMGLMRRMSLDRCLPAFFLKKNAIRHTEHWIIILFFITAASLYLILNGDVEILSGVYTIAFLSVMIMFGAGTVLLKWKRAHLPREVDVGYLTILIAIVLVGLGLMGNIIRSPKTVQYFVIYLMVTLVLVITMFQRIFVLKIFVHLARTLLAPFPGLQKRAVNALSGTIMSLTSQRIVFFAPSADLYLNNKAALYIRQNEQTTHMAIVHAHAPGDTAVVDELVRNVKVLDALYPKLRIDVLTVEAEFGPDLVKWVSDQLGVPSNFMFIACPGENFKHNFASLGGVRIITHRIGRDPVLHVTTGEVTLSPVRRRRRAASVGDAPSTAKLVPNVGVGSGVGTLNGDGDGGGVSVGAGAGAGAGAGTGSRLSQVVNAQHTASSAPVRPHPKLVAGLLDGDDDDDSDDENDRDDAV